MPMSTGPLGPPQPLQGAGGTAAEQHVSPAEVQAWKLIEAGAGAPLAHVDSQRDVLSELPSKAPERRVEQHHGTMFSIHGEQVRSAVEPRGARQPPGGSLPASCVRAVSTLCGRGGRRPGAMAASRACAHRPACDLGGPTPRAPVQHLR